MSDVPLILDVDTGIDDAIAIGLAVARSSNLLGISTVAGNVPIETATRNTLDVLALLGRSDVSVHRGASRPLTATYEDATHVHGGNGLGGVELTASTAREATLPGPAFLLQSAARYAGELTLVTLGPLTNLAIALNVRPEIVHQVKRVVVMGGAFYAPGNVTPHAEFNVYVDPDAAKQVFAAAWNEIVLIGLDVTHQTVLSRDAWTSIPDDAAGAAGLVRDVMRRTFEERGMSGFYLHDPLAVAVALDHSLVRGERRPVDVLVGEQRGRTVPGSSGRGPVVATEVEAARFVSGLCASLGLPSLDQGTGHDRAE